MNQSMIKDTDFAPDVLGSPLALTQYIVHSRQEGRRKKKEEERKIRGDRRMKNEWWKE